MRADIDRWCAGALVRWCAGALVGSGKISLMEIAVETGEDLSTVEDCIRVVNRFHWNLEVYDDGALHLLTGDGHLGTFESEQEMATFLKGAAFALAVLPDEVREVYGKWIGLDIPPT